MKLQDDPRKIDWDNEIKWDRAFIFIVFGTIIGTGIVMSILFLWLQLMKKI